MTNHQPRACVMNLVLLMEPSLPPSEGCIVATVSVLAIDDGVAEHDPRQASLPLTADGCMMASQKGKARHGEAGKL